MSPSNLSSPSSVLPARPDHRLWVLVPSSLVLLPFLGCTLLGMVPNAWAGLVGAGILGTAAWKTQGHPSAGVRSPGIAALLAVLFGGLWLREAVLCDWPALLTIAPAPAVITAGVLAVVQLVRGRPDPHLIEGASTVLLFAAAGLAGLTLPMLWP